MAVIKSYCLWFHYICLVCGHKSSGMFDGIGPYLLTLDRNSNILSNCSKTWSTSIRYNFCAPIRYMLQTDVVKRREYN
jgi:hypothetical protein